MEIEKFVEYKKNICIDFYNGYFVTALQTKAYCRNINILNNILENRHIILLSNGYSDNKKLIFYPINFPRYWRKSIQYYLSDLTVSNFYFSVPREQRIIFFF